MFGTSFLEWQKVVGQVVSYQTKFASRYGFIITDDVLIVMRISCERTGPGIATSRVKRPSVVQNYDDSLFANTTASFNGDDISFANTTASFIDDQPINWEMNMPEYAVVHWETHGPKRLTIKLALWCLAMMAVKGGNHVDCSYPTLNSWRVEAGHYVHNTSGASKTRLGHRDIIQGLDPGADGESSYAEDEILDTTYGGYSQGDEQEEEGSGAGDAGGHGGEDSEDSDQVPVDTELQTHGDDGWGLDNAGEDGGVAGGHDSDTETVIAGLRRMRVTIKKRMLSRRPYFVDARGRDVDTDITEWTRVRHHYELSGRRHVYVADTFPS